MSTHRLEILYVIESLGLGGAERLLVTTLRHLDRERFDPSVVTVFGPDPLRPPLEELGIAVESLGLTRPAQLLTGTPRLARMMRSRPPDIVHTHLFYANVMGRMAARWPGLRTRPRVITTLHNPDYTFEPPRGLSGIGKRWIDRVTGHRINSAFLAVSDAVCEDYRRQMGFSPITVLPNYIDVRELQERVRAVDRARQRARLGVGAGTVVVLNVARHKRQKGIDLLLEAFAAVAEGSDVALVQVGAGPDSEELKGLASTLGIGDRVHWIGPTDDVSPYLRAADLFAFPSRFEAFGIAALEAMAAGLPVVVSNTGGLPDLVEDGGILVPPGDPRSLAIALSRLIEDVQYRVEMGARAGKRAEAFSAERIVPQLEGFYEAD